MAPVALRSHPSAELSAFGLLGLLAIGCAIFVVAHDLVAVSIVVPQVQKEFSSDLQTVQWALTLFSIGLAVAVVPAGRLADLFGPRQGFIATAWAFGAASALVALAPTIEVLLIGRAMQGLTGGALYISSIALLFEAFGNKRASYAGAFLVGISGFGSSLAPIDAGLLISWLGWRAVFLVNVPICVFAAVVLTGRHPAERKGEGQEVDWPGVTILGGALMTLLVTLRYVPDWGWGSIQTLAGLAIAALFVVMLILWERSRGESALIPAQLLAEPRFALALAGEALLGLSYFVVLGLSPQIFDHALGSSPIVSGLMLASSMLAYSVAGALTGYLGGGLGAQIRVPLAGAIAVLGALLLSQIPTSPSYVSMLPGLLLVGLGTGSLFSSLVSIGVGSVHKTQSGLAAGVLLLAQLGGGAIGLGAVTAVVAGIASTAAGSEPEALVQGARMGFLLCAGIGAMGVLITLAGYAVLARATRLRAST